MPSATREIEINVPPDVLMSVITDFESYPEFIPEMVSARVVRQHGDTWEVAFGIR